MSSRFFRYFFASVTVFFFSFVHGAKVKKVVDGGIALGSKCDVYQGSWVLDTTYKSYDPLVCPFVRKEFACKKFGRQDDDYLKYRWQPNGCNIPRFDGEDFLRRFKGKKIMFIGDSLSRNIWISLSCLIHAAVPTTNYTLEKKKGKVTPVTFKDYGVQLILFHSLYFVDIEKEGTARVMKLDSIKDGNVWKTMDVLVFNSYQWWGRQGDKKGWDRIQEGGKTSMDMDRMVAFRKALTTWANWINTNIDPSKTKVFFQGISPSHYNGMEWNKPAEKSCANETRPLAGSIYPGGAHPATKIVNEVLATIKKPIQLLDITTLSQLRPDAHPGMHSGLRGMDCTHWCLPGLPDTWSQLLYSSLISQQ